MRDRERFVGNCDLHHLLYMYASVGHFASKLDDTGRLQGKGEIGKAKLSIHNFGITLLNICNCENGITITAH